MYPIHFSILLCFFSIILFNLATSASSNHTQYQSCVNSTCNTVDGKSQIIAYPFWGWNNVPYYCGFSHLKLNCSNILTIDINKKTYNVINIDYETETLTISIPQASDTNFLCPQNESQLFNTSLDHSLFGYGSGSLNGTLFYNCTNPEGIVPYNFTCTSSGGSLYNPSPLAFKENLGFLTVNKTWENKLRMNKSCSFEVRVPVLKRATQGLIAGPVNITTDILYKGFDVNWVVNDTDKGYCKNCSRSGGRCGYNNETLNERNVCLCQGGGNSEICPNIQASLAPSPATSPPRFGTTELIGMGAAGAFGILGMCILCFLYINRKKWYKNRSLPAYIAGNKSSRQSYSSSTLSGLPSMNGSTYFGVQLYSYKELEQATDFFNPSKELGDGGFGTVYYAKLEDGREVAIKRLYENNSKRAQQFMNEVEILSHLRHKNLVTLYGCTSRQSRDLLLVYEYVANGTVADHLRGPKGKSSTTLPWSTRLNIAVETADALLYLHASDIIHRDVKTQNVLLDRDFSVKVADFGLSRLFPLDVTHVSTAPQGTPGYVDPEYYQCYQLTEKSDVYSFGVMLAELISTKPAVDITRKRQDINLANMAMNKIQDNALHEFVDPLLGFESDFKVKKEITAVAELAFRCLQGTREMRPSMEEVLQNLREFQDSKADKPEVVDIPDYDVHMFKSDFSPGSNETDNDSATRSIPHASV